MLESVAMSLAVVVLAAGQGKRMHSALPKVLHRLAGRPLLAHVLAAAQALQPQRILVVHGHGGAEVRSAFDGADKKNLPLFKERGLIEVRYSDEERQQLIDKAAKPVWDKWVKETTAKGIPAQELLDLTFATAKKASGS